MHGAFDWRRGNDGYFRQRVKENTWQAWIGRINAGTFKKKQEEIRGKITDDLEEYFPKIFSNPKSIVFWEKQKERLILACERLIGNANETKEDEVERFFASQIKPKNFSGKNSDEIKHDKAFDKNIIALSPYINKPISECSTKEYFSLLEWHNDQTRKQGKYRKK